MGATKRIGNQKKKIEYDKIFVDFILAWHNLRHSEQIGLTSERHSPAYQKRIKRRVQKDYGTEWKKYWKDTIKRGWKEQDAMKQTKNLFWLEPVPEKPKHRPRKDEKYLAIYHLRNYFIKLTGKPQMPLIAEIFNEDYATLKSEYNRRKKYIEQLVMSPLDKELYVDSEKSTEITIAKTAIIKTTDELIQFYEENKDSIKSALLDGIPIYERFSKCG